VKKLWLLGAVLWTAKASPVYAEDAPAAPSAAVSTATPPNLVHVEDAEVPAEARRLEATVGLVITVAADGSVADVQVVAPAGHGLDEAAAAAARRFVFEPARKDGVAVAARVRYDYAFHAARPPQGRLEGRVLDGEQPIGELMVVVLDERGIEVAIVTSDAEGRFVADLPPGRYHVHARNLVDADEDIVDGQATVATYRRVPSPAAAAGASYGATARVAAPEHEVTRRTIGHEELQSAAGTRGDPLRTIELLPGVARPPGGQGVLIVRGSAPEDSQLYVDGSQVIRIYHFGGLTSFAPGPLIDKLELFPGNFGVRYGRATGSTVELRLRDPRSDGMHAFADVNLLDAGALVESPLGGGWSIAAGARRSTIDLWFASVAGEGAAQVTAAPVYLDYQLLLAWKGNGQDHLRLQIYGSDDEMGMLLQPGDKDPSVSGGLALGSDFHRAQLVWDHRYSARAEHEITATIGTFAFDTDVGPSLHQAIRAYDFFARSEWRLRPASWLRLVGGADVMVQVGDIVFRGPRIQQQEGNPGLASEELGDMPMTSVDEVVTLARPAGYAEATFLPVPSLELTGGVRLDYFGDDDATTLDLRSSARWRVTPATTLKGGLGQFSQPPDYGEAMPGLGNPDLGPEHALHASLGVEEALGTRASIGLEGYGKWLTDLIIGDASGMLTNAGEGRIFGVEVAGRLLPGGRFSGFLSYSLSRSERRAPGGDWRLFDADQTHVLTAATSWRIGGGWSAGATARLVSGNPETPVVGSTYDAGRDRYVPTYGATNSERAPLFRQLDLRLEKVWSVAGGHIAVYLDVQNATSAQNEEQPVWSYDYRTRGAVHGMPLLPSLGIRGEL
jgi:TonB family protein